MHEFELAWKTFHPHRFPVGYMLREAGEPHWLRFHSLPRSKRYAETDAEREIILARQNELAEEVLGDSGACWLVQAYGEIRNPNNASGEAARECHLSWAFQFLLDDEPYEAQKWNVSAGQTSWKPGKFDELLWAIANERAVSTLWMAASNGSIFAPYDGGVDLFLRSQQSVSDLKAKYPSWLSHHPEGL